MIFFSANCTSGCGHESSSQKDLSAAKSTSTIVWFAIAAALVVAVDLLSKWLIFSMIKPEQAIEVIPGFLYFRLTENRGAVFGVGQGKIWIFVIASIVAMVFITQLFLQSKAKQWLLHLLLSFTLGGAIGNLYDRIVFKHVRDFIYTRVIIGDREIWPWIFNVADVALVVGVCGLILGWMTGNFKIGEDKCKVARPMMIDDAADVDNKLSESVDSAE